MLPGCDATAVVPLPKTHAYATGRATTVTSKPRNDTPPVVPGTPSPQNNVVSRVMPGHATVPGGLACTRVRGSGVSCHTSAGDGGDGNGGVPGPRQRGTISVRGPWMP